MSKNNLQVGNFGDPSYHFSLYRYKDDLDTAYLSNVFVEEKKRNKGLGNNILFQAENFAKNNFKAKVIVLKVIEKSWMHDWYQRHGYIDFERCQGDKSMMWMKKELSLYRNQIIIPEYQKF